MAKRRGANINHTRRAEIGAERRSRTRAAILLAALDLLGNPHGRAARIEDVCARAHIARGTFYNYFVSMEELLESLSGELTRDFDAAVHAAFDLMETPAEQTCAAIRYYIHGAIEDPRWGWAMVNSSVGMTLFGEEISSRVRTTIQDGIDAGEFTIESADIGRDILLGTGVAATISVLHGDTPSDYPETVAYHLLLSLGASRALARKLTRRPLAKLPALSTESQFFRGALGGQAQAVKPAGPQARPGTRPAAKAKPSKNSRARSGRRA